jgi:hypothetical protein
VSEPVENLPVLTDLQEVLVLLVLLGGQRGQKMRELQLLVKAAPVQSLNCLSEAHAAQPGLYAAPSADWMVERRPTQPTKAKLAVLAKALLVVAQA